MNLLKGIIFLALFICLLPLSFENVSSMDLLSPDELVKPINKRLQNGFSEFENSEYIDKQVCRFMERSSLKGASIAFVKNEELVFCRSYGFADYENGIVAKPENLYRLASVSKLVTTIAIMKLVEEGKMNLNDKVFGKSGYFNEEKYLNIRDQKLKKITILNLLNHTSGWTQRYGDPAFNPLAIADKAGNLPPASIDSYLKYVISRRLYFEPGTMYSYSNMAYMFLGTIIEKVTGMKYEDFVRYHILFPNGIYDMHIAHNLYQEKLPNEVRYYEQEGSPEILSCNGDSAYVPKSYGGNDISLLGAGGGWIASAPELAKLLTLIDGFEKVPDILTAKSIEQMTGGLGNPLGWKEVANGYWYRTGSFAGTAAMLHRRPDGMEWVFLTNTSNWQGPGFSDDINHLMRKIMNKVDNWPNQNLFNYFDPEAISYLPIIDETENPNIL